MRAEQWKTTIHLPHMNLIIFLRQRALPLCSSTINQLWFSTFQLACYKTLQSAVMIFIANIVSVFLTMIYELY